MTPDRQRRDAEIAPRIQQALSDYITDPTALHAAGVDMRDILNAALTAHEAAHQEALAAVTREVARVDGIAVEWINAAQRQEARAIAAEAALRETQAQVGQVRMLLVDGKKHASQKALDLVDTTLAAYWQGARDTLGKVLDVFPATDSGDIDAALKAKGISDLAPVAHELLRRMTTGDGNLAAEPLPATAVPAAPTEWVCPWTKEQRCCVHPVPAAPRTHYGHCQAKRGAPCTCGGRPESTLTPPAASPPQETPTPKLLTDFLKVAAHSKCSPHACAYCQSLRRLVDTLPDVHLNIRGEVFTDADLVAAGQDWGETPAAPAPEPPPTEDTKPKVWRDGNGDPL